MVGSSLDGHFVLGHIDFKTTVKKISPDGDSTRIRFDSPKDYQKYIAKKGSICINGVSLTVSETTEQDFEVCLIPYTLSHTNLGRLQIGNYVNIEIDIISTGGKSRPETGSTGDGFEWLKKLGHAVVEPDAALVPVKVADAWVKRISGLSLPEVKIPNTMFNTKSHNIPGNCHHDHN
jgi:hypothetical protein